MIQEFLKDASALKMRAVCPSAKRSCDRAWVTAKNLEEWSSMSTTTLWRWLGRLEKALRISSFSDMKKTPILDSAGVPTERQFWFTVAMLCVIYGVAERTLRDNFETMGRDSNRCIICSVDAIVQSLVFVSESGMYDLVMMSRKPEAKAFKRWLTQAQLAELYKTSVPNICLHIGNILDEEELQADSVIKDSLITASDGKSYRTKQYNLEMLIALG